MLPLIFIVIVSINVFKQAKRNGRNPYLWTTVGVVVFYGIQLGIGFAAGIILYFTAGEEGFADVFTSSALLISIAGLIASGAGAMAVLWFVSRLPSDPAASAPPQPSFFGLDD